MSSFFGRLVANIDGPHLGVDNYVLIVSSLGLHGSAKPFTAEGSKWSGKGLP